MPMIAQALRTGAPSAVPQQRNIAPQFDPYPDIQRASEFARGAVEAYGRQLQPLVQREIGNALGGLNSIGALRSGGTRVALGEINRDFADRVGTYASQEAGRAFGYGSDIARTRAGLDVGDRQFELDRGELGLAERRQNFEESEARRRRRSGVLSAIGSVLGAGIGFAVGGPGGAAVGSQLAGQVTRGSEQG